MDIKLVVPNFHKNEFQFNYISSYVEIKCQLDATDEFLLQILLLAQHVSGTIMPIIRSSRVLYHLYNTLELLMMGIIVPETC